MVTLRPDSRWLCPEEWHQLGDIGFCAMWVAVLLIVPSVAFSQSSQINCDPLDPRVSITKEAEAKLQASVSTVYKIAQAGGQIERRTKDEIQNLPRGVTGKEQIEARWIYLFCEMLRTSKDMSEAQKSKTFDAVLRATQKPTPQTPSPQSKTFPPSVGRINWNFSSFLAGGVYGEYGARIGGFQTSAVNHTGGPLRDVHGYIESLFTGKRFELFLNINGLPVKPEDTYGIPNGARFLVYAPFKPGERQANSWEQLTLNEFLSELGEFDFVFIHDGKKFSRRFTKEETDKATQHWKEILSGSTAPRVVKKEKPN
jgi:hypothetical protein